MEDRIYDSLRGHFLIAMPGLMDPNFHLTVTCICEHSMDGTMGLIVNRPHPSIMAKLIFEELRIDYSSEYGIIPIYIGGPVHTGEIFVLHGPPFEWEACLNISDNLALSNSKDILEAIAKGEGPEQFIINLGCAGWGGGQLEKEIKENAWLTCPSNENIIFNILNPDKWNETIKNMGIDPIFLSDTAGNA